MIKYTVISYAIYGAVIFILQASLFLLDADTVATLLATWLRSGLIVSIALVGIHVMWTKGR